MSPHVVHTPSETSSASSAKECGHPHHVGSCGCCQRIQLDRWSRQLASVPASRRAA